MVSYSFSSVSCSSTKWDMQRRPFVFCSYNRAERHKRHMTLQLVMLRRRFLALSFPATQEQLTEHVPLTAALLLGMCAVFLFWRAHSFSVETNDCCKMWLGTCSHMGFGLWVSAAETRAFVCELPLHQRHKKTVCFGFHFLQVRKGGLL